MIARKLRMNTATGDTLPASCPPDNTRFMPHLQMFVYLDVYVCSERKHACLLVCLLGRIALIENTNTAPVGLSTKKFL